MTQNIYPMPNLGVNFIQRSSESMKARRPVQLRWNSEKQTLGSHLIFTAQIGGFRRAVCFTAKPSPPSVQSYFVPAR